MSKANSLKTSLLWSAVEQFGSQGLSVIITIVIARILTPEDYGLIAMLTIFMALSQVFINSGFSNYLIQNINRSKDDFNTVFYLNIIVGILCYITLYTFSATIANFYNQPILKEIIKIYSLVLIISSFTLVQRAIIYINHQYKKLSTITIAALTIAGGTAIYLAKNGWGVWALVSYNLIESGCSSLFIWITSKWYPSLSFSLDKARKAFSFGSKLLGANLLSSSVSNLYTLVIGKVFHAVDLGYYNRGQSLAVVFPSNFANMIQKASYPFLCENQNDVFRLKEIFIKYINLSCLVSFPVMMLILCISEPLVVVILTDKWLPAVKFLQILCIGSMFDPIMRLNSIILSVTGKTRYALYSEICKKIILLIILFSSLPFGLIWVTIGAAIYPLFDLIVVSFFVRKIIPFSFFDEVKIVTPYLIFSFGALLIAYFPMSQIPFELGKLGCASIIYLAFYIILLKIFAPKQFCFIKSNLNSIISRHG